MPTDNDFQEHADSEAGLRSSQSDCAIDEEARRRFEVAWRCGQPEPIERYLPASDHPHYASTAEELIHIELEFAWKAMRKEDANGQSTCAWPTRLEAYLDRFPALNQPPALTRLVMQEFEVRQRYGDGPSLDEYRALYPKLILEELPYGTTNLCSPGFSPEPLPDSVMMTAPGEKPRYRPVHLHARGGLGEVFVAEDVELGRSVAIKTIQGRYLDDPVGKLRFRREAEITARLQHPGIVPVYGLVHDEAGRPFYAMRFIDGEPLDQAVRRFHETGALDPKATPRKSSALKGLWKSLNRSSFETDDGADHAFRDKSPRSLDFRQLLSHFVAVCNAVAYAHSQGIIHRDLKPQNIMLGKFGETLVVDWGLACCLDIAQDQPINPNNTIATALDGDLTETGQVLGTPAYMSPEQAAERHDVLGRSSDIYSLGATLYTLLTGRAPALGNLQQVLEGVRRGDIQALRSTDPSLPPELVAIHRKAMAVEPKRRYTTALELAADVQRWLADEPVLAHPNRSPGAWLRRFGRKNQAVGVVALVVLLAGLAFWWLLDMSGRRQAQLEQADRGAKQLSQRYLALARHQEDDGQASSRAELLAPLEEYFTHVIRTCEGDRDRLRELAAAYSGLGWVLWEKSSIRRAKERAVEPPPAPNPERMMARFFANEILQASAAQEVIPYHRRARDLYLELTLKSPHDGKLSEALSAEETRLAELNQMTKVGSR